MQTRHTWRWALLLVASAAPALAGCGPGTATVGGDVTVDGQALARGIIVFTPTGTAAGPPVTAEVRDGRYELRTVPGKHQVQVSAPVVVGKRKEYNGPNAPLVEITEERLPPRYNSSSELTFDVQPGPNTKNWALESKGKRRS